jgi:hypothetical protein
VTAPTPAPPPAPTSALSRRASLRLLATAPLAATLTACSGSGLGGQVGHQVDRLRAPRSTPPAPANADRPLVDAAVAATASLRSALAPHRGVDPRVADLVRLHTAHLRALGAPTATGTAVPLSGTGSGLLDQVRAREESLGALLARQASAAHDGRLARLFASMSAAIAQRTAGTLG